jgi:uncharacterized protein YbbK (DUF523 family)
MANVLISKCLLGVPCRYHGRELTEHSKARALRDAGHSLLPICPEEDGGLTTPRPPTRIVDGRCICGGKDVTGEFERGAKIALRIAQVGHAEKAYLVKGSPSCDRDVGVTGRALSAAGVRVIRV